MEASRCTVFQAKQFVRLTLTYLLHKAVTFGFTPMRKTKALLIEQNCVHRARESSWIWTVLLCPELKEIILLIFYAEFVSRNFFKNLLLVISVGKRLTE